MEMKNVIVDKKKYLTSLRAMMESYYSILKDVGEVPVRFDGILEGYIKIGLLLEITSSDELDEIIQESHYKIFGMSIEERKKKYKTKMKIDENDFDIPTFIRDGKILEF